MNQDLAPPGLGPLRIGLLGTGLAGGVVLRSLATDERAELVATADPRARTLDGSPGPRAYRDARQLCEDPDVEVVWVATPTSLHREHALLAIEAGKHVIVEKPFATSLAECDQMIQAAERAGVLLLAGGVRSLDPSFSRMRSIIASGAVGELRAIHAWAATTWLIRPREPAELDEAVGGGMIFNQAPHQIDTVRLLAASPARTLRAVTGAWSPLRPGATGYYSAILGFDDGVSATVTYNGYGYVSAAELVPWWSPAEQDRESRRATRLRRALAAPADYDETGARELVRTSAATAGPPAGAPWVPQDAGIVVASCTDGEIRQSAHGLYVYDSDGRREEPVDSGDAQTGAVTELLAALRDGAELVHDGRWGRATLEIVIAMATSSGSAGRDTVLTRR